MKLVSGLIAGLLVSPAVAQDWSGIYAGVSAGAGTGEYTQFAVIGDGVDVEVDGFVGGGYLGYNIQKGNIVFGYELGVSTGPAGLTPAGNFGPVFGCGSGDCVVTIDSFATVRGRLGYARDSWLAFASAGVAFGAATGGIENSTFFDSGTSGGWAAGLGGEYMFNQNWIARVEYLHVDLGDLQFGVTSAGDQFQARGSFDVLQAGVAYKF